ncbi:MAG: deoxyribose-phosphate aldolase, partial [Eubacteriales bacterium]
EHGAQEIDMVINVGMLKDRRLDLVKKDIGLVVEASSSALVKVIIETCYLTDEEKLIACQLAKEAGADFVKSSTGLGPGGANVGDIALMSRAVGSFMGVKASGGIRSLKDALAMIEAGATRIGTSSGIKIIKELEG